MRKHLVTVCLALNVLTVSWSGIARAADPISSAYSISPVETRLLGQRTWLRGGPAGLRIIVTNHLTGKPLTAKVSLSLQPVKDGKPAGASTTALYSGTTNSVGSLDASFHAPAVDAGSYELSIEVKSGLGEDKVTQPIQIQESTQVLLTADKPMYQPGQTVRLRALAMDMATRTALAGKQIVFEVEDARGNKVFKRRETLTKFGIASTDFVLADEVNMGTFTLRAILPEGETEKKVQVSRYVLPKFKMALSTDKTYYLPGDTVRGTLQAGYFFGKPVAGGAVNVTVNTIVIGLEKIGELKGRTDEKGAYKFEYTLPKSFVGQPFEQGKAVVEFSISLKDSADHKQLASVSAPVVKDPVSVLVVPEHRGLVPGVSNRIYLAAASADGAPLKHTVVRVKRTEAGSRPVPDTLVTTDDLGTAVYDFVPASTQDQLEATAADLSGRQGASILTLFASADTDAIILRSDRYMAKVGDKLNLQTLCSVTTGTLYFDVVRNKQTILTYAQPLAQNGGRFSLTLTDDMVGTIELHAYKIMPNEQIVRDTRKIIVSPAGDLDIKVALDRTEYRPGADATINFTVSDSAKHPVLAALGLAMVDESVFALSELQPGLEKIYFTLEKELMEPRYEIHGLKPTFLMQSEPGGIRRDERQRAAAMLLTAATNEAHFEVQIDTYQRRWAAVQMKLVTEMEKLHQTLLNAIAKYRKDKGVDLVAADSLTRLSEAGYIEENQLVDPWGHFYKANLYNAPNYNGYFTLSSAGPDGKWDTADDVVGVSMYGWSRATRFGGRGAFGGRGRGFEDNREQEALFKDDNALGIVDGVQFDLAAARPMGEGGIERFHAAGATQLFARTEGALRVLKSSNAPNASSADKSVRVREYFPETMLWSPALLTDEQGRASLTVPMADSITTWRLSVMGNTVAGQLGSATVPVKVFQDFFVDIDLPVSLTQNDRVELPVTVYNYMAGPQDVTVTLAVEPWFKLEGGATQRIHLNPGQVSAITYPINVKSIGRHSLQVSAAGTKLSDAIRRQIDVTPDGKESVITVNDNLVGSASKSVTIPTDAIEGASSLWVKLYPGSFSQVVEGLDGILRMPNGCFEQTSSTTYPNLLVLDYLKANKKANPEIQLKAEQYINIGYQRLVTFECKNGGFSWFGNEPAHQVLTAYGLLEFSDMARVHDVDPSLIQRTQNWLAAQQKADGTWQETSSGIAEGIINRQTGALRTTAYIAWALAESGFSGPQVERGVGYVKEHLDEALDPYTLAVILNLFSKTQRGSDATTRVADSLITMAKTDAKAAWWQSDTKTFTGATSEGADLETSGLAAFGLLKWGRNSGFTNKALTYLVQSRDSYGTWSTTQGTVWALKALLMASKGGGATGKGNLNVMANGQKVATIVITPDDSDIMRQINLKEQLKTGVNNIELNYTGDGSLLYQIVGRYYIPWVRTEAPRPAFEPLSIAVVYDKTKLTLDDLATVTATIHNNTDRIAEMPLVDLGIPPGFTVVPDQLEEAVTAGKISKYTVSGRQVIMYMEKLDPTQTLTISYQIRAKYPIKARTPLSKVYPYYNPARVAVSQPQDIVVTK